MMENLKEKCKKLPLSPGVYLMKDSNGCIIYVGKAKRLRRRVQSYFQHAKNHSPKVVKLVQQINDFDFIVTDTEFEAFLLECQLIKELKPFFNSLMKNPLSYVYISIKKHDRLPDINITEAPADTSGHYCFGPYTNKNTVIRAIEGIKEGFHINCSSPANHDSYCLNHSLGLCIGMCGSDSAVQQYQAIIKKFAALLSGTDTSILEEMKQKMAIAAENTQFETAGKWRDRIKAIQSLLHKEEVIQFIEENNRILVSEFLDDKNVKLFLIQRYKIIFSKKYQLSSIDFEYVKDEIKSHLCSASFHSAGQKTSRDEIDEAQIIYRYLSGSRNHYIVITNDWLQPEHEGCIDDKMCGLFLRGK